MAAAHTAAALPLALNRAIASTRSAQALPIAFLRQLGEADDAPVKPPRLPVPARDWGFAASAAIDMGSCLAAPTSAHALGATHGAAVTAVGAVSGCLKSAVATLLPLRQCRRQWVYRFVAMASELRAATAWLEPVRRGTGLRVGVAPFYGSCAPSRVGAVLPLRRQTHAQAALSAFQAGCARSNYPALLPTRACARELTLPVVTPPDLFHPLPLPKPPKPPCPCGERPPSGALPIHFRQRTAVVDAALLPIDFHCAQIRVVTIPILKGYTMLNTVSAHLGNTALDVLAVSIRADMAGFCWQVSLTLYPDAFAALGMDSRAVGEEAEIRVNINGEDFVFLAEDYSDNREFGRRSYTVSGRSVTAHLAADYARTRSGVVGETLYARQLADAQLQYLPYRIGTWALEDWRIGGGSYAITDKTPLDVLQDIARAGGGFVMSHPSLPDFTFAPRWPAAAWAMAEQSPAVTVPASVVVSISGQKRKQPRYNSVFAWADHAGGVGADIYRQGQDRGSRAPALVHPLFTDLPAHRQAGIAALSDSGVHKIETVKLPLSPDYSLPRATLGQVWQFNEPSGHWKGVITGVAIDAACDSNGAVTVWQTVTADRYLDV